MQKLHEFVSRAEAEALFSVSTKTLQRWRNEGFLRKGIEWRHKFPNRKVSAVIYHLLNCEKRMQQLSNQRPNQGRPTAEQENLEGEADI